MRRALTVVAGLLLLCFWPQAADARRLPSPASAPSAEEALGQDLGDLPSVLQGDMRRPGPMGATPGGLVAPSRSIAGSRFLQGTTDSVYLLYPGACYERDAGTWSPRSYPIADSLNTYAISTTGPYQQLDRSTQEKLWRIVDASTNPAQRPEILDGSRSLWCGKYEPNWLVTVGYPNLTTQILYIDTGTHAASYTLSMLVESSSEYFYDYVHVIGGGGGATDPIGNNQVTIDKILASGHFDEADLLVSWTGSIVTGGTIDVGDPPAAAIVGLPAGEPVPVSVSLTNVSATHRAIYVVFRSDDTYSHEDGRWPDGRGQLLDLIQTSDNGVLYDDQPQSLRPEPPHEPYVDSYGGEVLLGTDLAPVISARVPSGVGEFWHLVSGNTVPTGDYCASHKELPSDRMLSAADATTSLTVPGSWVDIRTCALPLPPGAWWVDAVSNIYFNLSGGRLVLQFRWHVGGEWVLWGESGAGVQMGGKPDAWFPGLAIGTAQIWGADSIQARYTLEVPGTAEPSIYGVLLDDLQLKVYTGTPVPQFPVGHYPQSTFIDGSMTGLNCSVPPCWPGTCGTEVPGRIDDNVNSGDTGGIGGDGFSILIEVGIRRHGMGVNWRNGHGVPVGGVTPQYVNGSFNPAYDAPRMIYRLFDPATLTWSPFDSTLLFASLTHVAPDTLVAPWYSTDWPPQDRLESDASLPGGFTINGHSRYSDLRFLPRGTRLQYYWKAVDMLGGVAYDFGDAGETEDLPLLPGSSIRAPDIFEFDVLPRVYPPGATGTLLAGRTDTPILNLDSSYRRWGALGGGTSDPVTQALRALGVRADRYRQISGVIGGHPFGNTDWFLNCWPNMEEYGILDVLADQYRIIIEPWNVLGTPFNNTTSKLIHAWWDTSTGTNGGDRCIFTSGDDVFSTMAKAGAKNPEMLGLMTDVFGVSTVLGTWTGGGSNLYPTLDDRFTGGGPGLAPANTFTYPLDGGCPNLRRFDGLTKIASADAQNAVIFPSGAPDVAGIARMSEMDANSDTDRNKALCHSFGIERIRAAGIPPSAPNYVHSGLQNRMRMLYKFLTACRGPRNSTVQCWPCPGSPGDLSANWASATSFETETYGPLYAIQDHTQASPVEVVEVPRWVNELRGNYPNPFNPQTTIRFTAVGAGRVTVRVFDVAGRLVSTLVKQVGEAGPQELRWDGKMSDGRAVSSGVYFYRMRFADGEESAAKMMLLK